jgi:hypothetical protein
MKPGARQPVRLWLCPNPAKDRTGPDFKILILNKHLTHWKDAKSIDLIPGRTLLLTLPWHGNLTMSILAIYTPNTPADNATFFRRLTQIWTTHNYPGLDALVGDFNLVEDPLDCLPAHGDSQQATEALHDFKQMHLLADGWCRQSPTSLGYTFLHPQTAIQSRIDCIYVQEPILPLCHGWDISPTAVRTDHKLISAQITQPEAPFIG